MRKTTLVLCLGFMALNANAGIYVGPPPSRSDDGAPTSTHGRSTSPALTARAGCWLTALSRRWDPSGDSVTSSPTWSLLLQLLTGSETCPRS